MPTTRRWYHDWGFWVLTLEAVITFLVLAFKPVALHYVIFSEPGPYLWKGGNPYGTTFSYGTSGYFYSPACAMLFFSWFAWMPERLGQFVYMTLSLAILVGGAGCFLRAVKSSLGWDFWESRYRNWVCLMISSELIGSILTAKLELAMVGMALFAVSLLLTDRRIALAGVLFGVLLNWKLQPLPIIGLILLAQLLLSRKQLLPFALGVAGIFAVLYPLPFPFQTWEATQAIHLAWKQTLVEFMARDWLAFHHVYTFMHRVVGWSVSFETAQKISALCGGVMALTLTLWIKSSGRMNSKQIFPKALLLALSLGCGFIVCFSPLSQSNAYIWYAPTIFVFGWVADITKPRPWLVYAILLTAFYLISLLYSDLNPRPIYRLVFASGVKPLGVLLLLVTTFVFFRMGKADSCRDPSDPD